MELKLDTGKVYAIALEGGGARGAWQVGVWRALQEAGIRYNAVSGTSVGALNGAMMAMGQLEDAERLWKDIRFSQVMNVDDATMHRIMNRDFENLGQIWDILRSVRDILRNGGLDVEPLRNLLSEWVDEDRIRNSSVDFFLSTYSLTDRKEMDVVVKELPDGEIQGMLMASAYLPVFKQEKIGGKHYADGGVYDVIPISALVSRGYKDILALRLHSLGIERRVKIPEDVSLIDIEPSRDLGSMLNFSSDRSAVNMAMGYYDGQRILYGLHGKTYYIDRTMTEREAYEMLISLLPNNGMSLRELNEDVLSSLAGRLRCRGDYYDLLIAVLERLAVSCSVSPFRIRTDREFFDEVIALRTDDIPDKPDRVLDLFLGDS